jgi:hypothetical protein
MRQVQVSRGRQAAQAGGVKNADLSEFDDLVPVARPEPQPDPLDTM